MSNFPPLKFGTDGIRGKANQPPLTADQVLRLAQAAGIAFRNGSHRHTVVIGKDTRLSGYLFESALEAGFTSVGVNCQLVGPLPTPAIAFLTRALRADAGVVISASHNPYDDNGIKFFGPTGMKLPDALEQRIEALLAGDDIIAHLPPSDGLGRALRLEDAPGRYIEFCKNSFPRHLRLDGLKVVVDCANGAAYRVAPTVFWELGAEVVVIGNQPNGLNINAGCGSLHPEGMAAAVRQHGAHLGVAFDGDADRLILCDERGQVLDGDHILAMTATAMQAAGELRGGGVVATVMSNLGLERLLNGQGLTLVRTNVGDRHVLTHMVEHGFNVGGEQSGHMLFLDHNTTGDGLIAALQVLKLVVESGRPLSELAAPLARVPQVLKNVRIAAGSDPLSSPPVQRAMATAERELAGVGRLLVRKSGTEPKIRVMVEGDDPRQIETMADALCQEILAAAGS